ncbi:MAG: hypothetical protein H6821_02465 [Planctomycetaceae bacterium]|nr:hypothetical protein [Planctomycetales bacterium]MCB9873018.1 hypothetical protein [Planctomycetaceae bacterium]MCB9937011.1 hypothetical protein [Planctomycetaceae bacterium]HRX83228.1 hypothetical protein [Pirellulaceae bacterium]
MPTEDGTPTSDDMIEVDLRNPVVAAVWGWVCPGAGHIYQRRYAKGVLFMVCILSTWFFGLSLGEGHVVYASWKKDDHRWQYLCQLGVGTPALPAIVQSQRVKKGKEPLFDGWMAPPQNVVNYESPHDELSQWHLKYHAFFELGTLYTMIAGLLNVLAIYDAYAGPMVIASEEQSDKPPPDDQDDT